MIVFDEYEGTEPIYIYIYIYFFFFFQKELYKCCCVASITKTFTLKAYKYSAQHLTDINKVVSKDFCMRCSIRQRLYVACGKRLTAGGMAAALPVEVALNH
jgi:hypothetical protein